MGFDSSGWFKSLQVLPYLESLVIGCVATVAVCSVATAAAGRRRLLSLLLILFLPGLSVGRQGTHRRLSVLLRHRLQQRDYQMSVQVLGQNLHVGERRCGGRQERGRQGSEHGRGASPPAPFARGLWQPTHTEREGCTAAVAAGFSATALRAPVRQDAYMRCSFASISSSQWIGFDILLPPPKGGGGAVGEPPVEASARRVQMARRDDHRGEKASLLHTANSRVYTEFTASVRP